jgi:hypothetical protein
MKDWIIVLIIIVIWLVLQFVIFPKIGVPT